MPDIDDGIGKRQATARIDNGYIQQERNPRPSLGNVGPKQFVFDVVWADFLLCT
jgi:hypothetical protein